LPPAPAPRPRAALPPALCGRRSMAYSTAQYTKEYVDEDDYDEDEEEEEEQNADD